MTETITRMYDTYPHALQAVTALKSHGLTDDQISLVAHAGDTVAYPDAPSAAGEDAGVGAGIGGAVGAGAGLLTGLGLLAIPGVGPVVAAGWLAATAVGAVAGAIAGGAAGGIVGSLTGAGVSESDANVYAEGVRRGGSLVTVRAPDNLAPETIRILDSFSPIDPGVRGAEYRSEGWEHFDEKASPYVSSDPSRQTPPTVTR